MNRPSLFPMLSRPAAGENQVSRLRQDIDRIFSEFLGSERMPSAFYGNAGDKVLPSAEIKEDENAVSISVELPGLDESDIDVSVHDQVVTISGEKKQKTEKKEEDFFVTERSYGKFSRSLTLPFTVDPDTVDANYEKGVLTLTIPKPALPEKTRKRIPVKGPGEPSSRNQSTSSN